MTSAERKLPYRLITGPDDEAFCQRVTEALEDGYRLHGAPGVGFDGVKLVAAQALVLDIAVDKSGSLR